MPCIVLVAGDTKCAYFCISQNSLVISNRNSNPDKRSQREDAMASTATEGGSDGLHRHLDSEGIRASPGPPFLSLHPSPLPQLSLWCFPSHSSSCSDRSPLPDYVLIASRPSALGKAFPPLGLVYPISVFCCRKTNQGTSTESGTLVLGQWYPFPPSRKEWSHSLCYHINCLCLCFAFFFKNYLFLIILFLSMIYFLRPQCGKDPWPIYSWSYSWQISN